MSCTVDIGGGRQAEGTDLQRLPGLRLGGGQYVKRGIDQAWVGGNLSIAPAWAARPQWLAEIQCAA